MTVVQYAVRDLMRLLQDAATTETTVSYSQAWELFDHGVPQGDRWDTIAEAADRLSDPCVANYGALMATRDTALPGAAIFRFLQESRPEVYGAVAGELAVDELSPAQKKALAESERRRVYDHARS